MIANWSIGKSTGEWPGGQMDCYGCLCAKGPGVVSCRLEHVLATVVPTVEDGL